MKHIEFLILLIWSHHLDLNPTTVLFSHFPKAYRYELSVGDLLIRAAADSYISDLDEDPNVERICVVLDHHRTPLNLWSTEVLFLQTNRIARVEGFYNSLWMWHKVIV